MATDIDGTKTWKGITWKRGERLPGARGKNRGIMATHRANKRTKAELIAEEVAERERLRNEDIRPAVCETCGSGDILRRLNVSVSFDGADQVFKSVPCNDSSYHGKPKKKRKKRHPFVPPKGGELLEKVL